MSKMSGLTFSQVVDKYGKDKLCFAKLEVGSFTFTCQRLKADLFEKAIRHKYHLMKLKQVETGQRLTVTWSNLEKGEK